MTDELENDSQREPWKRKKWFLQYITNLGQKSVVKECSVSEFHCPCCNFPTLPERGAYHICPLCFWEDDGQDEPFEDEVWGGPNGNYSLSEARNNFSMYLTCYRPSDTKAFEINTQKNPIKKQLIEKYQELYVMRDKSLCQKLKNEIKKIIDKLC
jgi:hypothetical protein